MVDLKRVYQALNKEAAESALDELEKIWGDKYPILPLR
jgi:transposase-like protein